MTTIEKGSKNIVKVKLFGLFTEIIGKREITIMMSNGTTVGNLKKKITEMYPSLGLADIPFVFAVNRRVAREDASVTSLDEIAILPPISGG